MMSRGPFQNKLFYDDLPAENSLYDTGHYFLSMALWKLPIFTFLSLGQTVQLQITREDLQNIFWNLMGMLTQADILSSYILDEYLNYLTVVSMFTC